MSVAVANARQTVDAPVRQARRYGLLSVVNVVDGGDTHWIMGGLTADGEECSKPLEGEIICGPAPAKTSRSWYSDIEGDPWLAYMYETCKTVGRYAESAAKLQARFLAAEQSAVERRFQMNVLVAASDTTTVGSFNSVPMAIGVLEQEAADAFGGQVTLHLPFVAAQEAAAANLLTRVGDHLETVTGSLVSIGNYDVNQNGGALPAPPIYATGAITLHRGPLTVSGPVVNTSTNDYYVLAERPYAAILDCLVLTVTGVVCACKGDPPQ